MISENKFEILPPVVLKLRSLKELFAQGNLLQSVPASMGKQLTQLNYLELSET